MTMDEIKSSLTGGDATHVQEAIKALCDKVFELEGRVAALESSPDKEEGYYDEEG